MARVLNVTQQNETTLAEIRRVAALFASGSSALAWLRQLLSERALSANDGLLIQLTSLPEQEGELHAGTWLTEAGQFWEFSAIASRGTGTLLEVERFENVTQSTLVSAHVPGTGKSLGYLALGELRARREG